mmetsp:Transcript_9781/g.10848  ORF Transcript_9781/g.10848 Transcript_9781/m.10848 type:complete len:281 (+) Transcript_9781:232-1074(+)
MYKRQPYPDNYVDGLRFLDELEKNVNVEKYDLYTMITDSTVVTQAIAVVVVYYLIFVGSLEGSFTPEALMKADFAVLVVGYLIWCLTSGKRSSHHLLDGFRFIPIVFGSVLGLSPVLRTLTEPISDDTLWTCVILLTLLHLYTTDYSYLAGTQKDFYAPTSVNAAIFASVLMASRLPTSKHVFAFLSLSIELFALLPIVLNSISAASSCISASLSIILNAGVLLVLVNMSNLFAACFVAQYILITFMCPNLLCWLQRYKNEIHGPWDEAVPTKSGALYKG